MVSQEISDKYPLSPLQQGMYFLSHYSPGSSVLLIQMAAQLREDLHPPSFWLAWQRVIERHSILRTSFQTTDSGDLFQFVHPTVEIQTYEEDLSQAPTDVQESKFQSYLRNDWELGFILSEPPLVRFALFKFGDKDFRFIRTIHHLLSDSWSSIIQYQEAFAFYEASQAGRALELPPSRQYKEYIEWLQENDFSESEGFWRSYLDGFQTPTPPFYAINPNLETKKENVFLKSDFGSQTLLISKETTRQLKEFTLHYDITLNTLLQGAWAILLSRYTGEEDVVFGATRNCRHSSFGGASEMVGPMVNTLPVRVKFSQNNPIIKNLRRLREDWIAMRAYEHSPLTSVSKWSGIPSNSRLIESVVNYNHMNFNTALRMQGDSWLNRDFNYKQNPGFPIALNGFGETEFILQIFYDRSFFEDDFIDRILQHIEVLLKDIVSHPESPVHQLNMLPPRESQKLLYEWNNTRVSFNADSLVHQMVDSISQKSPSRAAVVHGGKILTYGDLYRCSNQLANYLLEKGIKPDTLVGICVQRSFELIIASLAVLKAGGAFLLIDPENPSGRIKAILDDSRPLLVISNTDQKEKFAASDFPVLFLDRDRQLIDASGASCPINRANLENLAYVIYTSGSTGKPKGVEITHAGLLNLVKWHHEEFDISSKDRATQLASLSFDASIWEIWPYISIGAQLHLLEEEIDLAPERLIEWYRREGITISFLPTPIFESLLEIRWPDDLALHTILTGGDRLRKRPEHRLPFRLVNNYGPTECTVVTTSGDVTTTDQYEGQLQSRPPDIGRPISNVILYVVDEDLNPVPIGIPGELLIGGAGLGRGYLGRPELTAESFIRSPFPADKGKRLYRSGDIVRYLPSGNLEFLGRIDSQIKIRGSRVEPGEIEKAIESHASVKQAVVVDFDNERMGKELVAFVVPKDPEGRGTLDLSNYLKSILPTQMIPSKIIFLQELPLTNSGKINRQALSEFNTRELSSESTVAYGEPRTALEKALALLWADTLKREKVGVNESFFELGGHSILAIKLAAQIADIFDFDLSVRSVFDAPTVAGMADIIRHGAGADAMIEEIAELFLKVAILNNDEAERLLVSKRSNMQASQ